MTGIIILAAGSSSRLGRPKQNLVYKGKTLLERAIEAAMASVCKPVIVVLGANSDVIKQFIEDFDIALVQNAYWPEGMSSSIRAGVSELKKNAPNADSAILMLCDQPFVNADLIDQLVQKKSSKPIVASAYNNTIGPPVMFDAAYFDELLLLKGQEGAKKLMMKHANDVVTLPFPKGR